MKTAIVTIEGKGPYSQGKYHRTPELEKELREDYEKRTWREKIHYDENGMAFIPPMQFCNSLKEAAKYLSIPVPGGGKALFTKNFESSVIVLDPLSLEIHKDDVSFQTVFIPSNGRRGGGTRVEKTFPVFFSWKGIVTYYIYDDIITEDAFTKAIKASGQLIGIGRFRPRNMGYYGRFIIKNIEWIVD